MLYMVVPTALTVGVGLAAKNGILIKDGQTLEVSQQITHVLLDKTGTITVGQPVLSNIINYSTESDEEVLMIARSIEQYSQHPIAQALFNNQKKNEFELYDVDEFENISGKGVQATINNRDYIIGNKKIAILSVSDVIKENSKKAIDQLHKMNIKTTMISGDNKNTSSIVAKQVGISNVVSEVLPQEKLDYVKKLQSEGEIVAFIGDGINDAPSLTKSNVGIAIGTGTDVAIESGDIILINGDLLNAVASIQISRKTMSRVRLNLFWAFAYNVVLIPIAAGALIPWNILFRPEYSALAMALSSVTVITLSLLLRSYVPEIFRE